MSSCVLDCRHPAFASSFLAASVLKSVFPVVGNDFVANVNALITYVNLASRYQFLHLILRLSTERTTQHSVSLSRRRFRSLGRDTGAAILPLLWQAHDGNPVYCVFMSSSSVQI